MFSNIHFRFYVKPLVFGIFLILFSGFFTTLSAQKFIQSTNTSTYTYIFKISDEEAKKIYSKKGNSLETDFFHTLIDSFPTGETYPKKLLPGHYLRTYSNRNLQNTEIVTVPNLEVFILNNSQDLVIQLYDLEGKIIKDARVKLQNKTITFNPDSQVYKFPKTNKKGWLSVNHEGFTTYYFLNREYNNSAFKRGANKVLYNIPLKYAWLPVQYIARLPVDGVRSIVDGWSQGTIRSTEDFFVNQFRKIACLFDDYYCSKKTFKGYMVYSKPMYRPGDTLKFKSYIIDVKGRPYNKPVKVVLYRDNENLTLTTLNPYDKGGYAFEFFLHDSLKLKLDSNYSILLNDLNNNNLILKSFKYEDYELKKNQLSLRVPNKNHYKGQNLEVFIKATDENDLILKDARVQIWMKLKKPLDYFEDYLFIPDSLGYLEKQLDPKSETVIQLSDSLFPAANIEYELITKLLTTDNEVINSKENITYFYRDEHWETDLEVDSLKVFYKKNGLSANREFQLFGRDNFENETLLFEGESPAKFQINTFYSHYVVKSGEETSVFDISKKFDLLQVRGNRTKDSVKLEIYNPRNLFFNYHIYLKNRLLHSGYANELKIHEPLNSLENYQISLQYIWGGKVVSKEIGIPLKDKALSIEVDQPELIYPGQKTTIEVTVKDYKGNPVEGVDITALGLTKKFGYEAPQLPFLGKYRKTRNQINKFNINNSKSYKTIQEPLDYEYWKHLAGIDSIEFYKFRYPKNEIYQTSFYPADSITQFAPFVFSNGQYNDIYVIYVDDEPVYFSWTLPEYPYSFKITPGFHNIILRTSDKKIVLNNIYFPENQKLILSLDEHFIPEEIIKNKTKRKFGKQEIQLFSKYILPFQNTFYNKVVYLENRDNLHLISSGGYNYNYDRLVGPVTGKMSINFMDGVSQEFVHLPHFEYEFRMDTMKLRPFKGSLYPKKLRSGNKYLNPGDLVLTKTNFVDLYNKTINDKRTKQNYFHHAKSTQSGFGKLILEIDHTEYKEENPLNILILDNSNPDYLSIYPGNTREFHQLREGNYKLILCYPDKKYHKIEEVFIKENGVNFLRTRLPLELTIDDFSITIDEIIRTFIEKGKTDEISRRESLEQINIITRDYFYGEAALNVQGTVLDDSGLPLPGVNILIKGTTIGTQTDFDGNYSIRVNPGDILVFSYVGFGTKEINTSDSQIDIQLEGENSLSEVVVVTHYRRNHSAEVSGDEIDNILMGAAAGVALKANMSVQIRGFGSISADSEPLYIVNGMVYTGDINGINPENIRSVEILDSSEAVSKYGSRGANGVVIIQLKDGVLETLPISGQQTGLEDTFYEMVLEGSSLRQNFSDNAFWQPKLKTDTNGKVQFEVTFPDDVTNWDTHYLAMNGKKQSGQIQKSIKSYKPLMSQLTLPRFLIEQDTVYAIGKTLNYTNTEQEATITFEVNDSVRFRKKERFENAVIDTLMLTSVDSLSVKYTLEKSDGYFDGELREIPVYRQGLYKTEGSFVVLDHPQKVNLDFNPDFGNVNLYARADILEVLEDEINHVIKYKYLCNEQVASKLKMLLLQKKIAAFQQIPFKNEKLINKFIQHLIKNQNPSGFWGWWENTTGQYWISLHVLEALSMAKNDGFKVVFDTSNILDELLWKLETHQEFEEAYRILKILKHFDENIDYDRYLKMLEEKSYFTFYQQLLLTDLQQTLGKKYQLDTILKHKKSTIYGNVYFATESSEITLLNNKVLNTLLVYKILKRDTLDHSEILSKMRNYFLEQRQKGSWQNTYESTQIVETILDDFISEGSKLQKPRLLIEGDISMVVEAFPFELNIDPNKNITISKTGDFPVYFTGYQSYWESAPKPKSEDFEITTLFENKANLILKSGEEVTLLIRVKIKKDAEYVMINVPIPGGCSYADSQSKNRYESHRENFKNETAIFCEKLPQGEYYFEVKLIPRYTGKYTLNPAKIEMMYFPTFNANEGLKKVSIE